jgi:hypothetical protein
MHGPIIERVMRMGIEYHAGIKSIDDLWDLATKQLKKEKIDRKSTRYNSFEDWFNQQINQLGSAYACMYTNGKLEIVRGCDLTKIKFIEWRTSTMPLIELA